MANGRVGDIEGDVVLVGGLVLGFFLVAKPLLDQFGADPADVATINTQKTAQPSANCFSYQFTPFVQNFNAHPSYNDDGSVMTMQQFFQVVKANNDAGQPLLIDGSINIAQLGENLRSALSAWVVATDSTEVFAVFANFYNQTQVASLAAYLAFNYNQDLLTALTGSLFKTGLSTSDLALLIREMSALPVS